ncbi:MAG TPA: FecR family protein [Candidatus Mcinerneyibacterium sp.]|nr:FecR family protein [Candidatus Mcinerneyibacterium sp.]
MKKIMLFVLYFSLINLLFSLHGKLTYIEGEVFVNYSPADLNQKVDQNDLIVTGEGKVEVKLSDGKLFRLGPKTKIYLKKLEEKEKKDKKIKIKVIVGKFWTKVKKIFKKEEYKVEFKMGTAGVRGTVYNINQFIDDSAELYVYEGKVEVRSKKKKMKAPPSDSKRVEVEGPEEIEGPKEITMEEWIVIVEKMNRISISKKGELGDPEKFKYQDLEDDEWVNWNLKRDKLTE